MIMPNITQALASTHLETRFVRINVENAPFLVTKLKVQVLPCVLAFVDGVSTDRLIGFEGLGFSENTFETPDLEARLLKAGVLERSKSQGLQGNRLAKPGQRIEKADEDDDDWD